MSTQRCKPEDVQDILGKDWDPTRSLTLFLRTANRWVDRVITCLTSKGYSLDTEEASLMEAWLAAHAYTRSDPALASESNLGASGSRMGQTGMDLDASFYGQQAKALDPSGVCLTSTVGGGRATGAWLGRPKSAQTDYRDRD